MAGAGGAAAAVAAHSVRVLRELNRQRAAGQFCDATLGVGGRQFRAHWPVLASCSRFFRGVGGGGGGGPGGSPVPLPEGLADTFQLLLDFFYTGRLALTAHNRARLLAAAEQLGVPEAVALCRAFRPPPAAASRHRPRRAPNAPPQPSAEPPEPCGAATESSVSSAAPPDAPPAAPSAPAVPPPVVVVGAGGGGEEPPGGRKGARGRKKPPEGAVGSGKGAAAAAECPTCHKTFLSKYYLKVHNR